MCFVHHLHQLLVVLLGEEFAGLEELLLGEVEKFSGILMSLFFGGRICRGVFKEYFLQSFLKLAYLRLGDDDEKSIILTRNLMLTTFVKSINSIFTITSNTTNDTAGI